MCIEINYLSKSNLFKMENLLAEKASQFLSNEILNIVDLDVNVVFNEEGRFELKNKAISTQKIGVLASAIKLLTVDIYCSHSKKGEEMCCGLVIQYNYKFRNGGTNGCKIQNVYVPEYSGLFKIKHEW